MVAVLCYSYRYIANDNYRYWVSDTRCNYKFYSRDLTKLYKVSNSFLVRVEPSQKAAA